MKRLLPILIAAAFAGCASASGGAPQPQLPGPAALQALAAAPLARAPLATAPLATAPLATAPLATATPARTRTYDIAKTCAITSCSGAVLTRNGKAVGTISYVVGLGNGGYFGNTTFGGNFTFLTTTFLDFAGTFTDVGTVTIGGVPYSQWDLAGKMSAGRDTVVESFAVRGHSGRGGGNTIINLGGTVVTPFATPRPTPTPPKPTPLPTPTDS